ncbi:MAG: indole-3-glycerol phosphate synthase TrpC [Chloroflexi bacterium]|nr:indole-3-glycerol phosphate synthase TrpC [Chloroflexota bacterium]MYD49541.1 indole-3-glycerol phosphate synthase TrpC [Chloroflexota bacterium]
MPASILNQIVAKKREELAAARAATPLSALRERIAAHPPALDFAAALRSDGISLIAEVKKASPSKGLLRADFQPAELAATYADNGAAAISVITDGHFLGEPAHLTAVKESGASGSAPVLRKDFLFDPYQVHEARAIGADTYLLIVDILSPSQLSELIDLGKSLGMTPLVETHDADEIATAIDAGAEVIGINNRDLHTFVTDLATTEELAALIPRDKVIVSESGISTPDDLARLEPHGVNAVLVGEALVTAADTAAKVRSLTGAPALVAR